MNVFLLCKTMRDEISKTKSRQKNIQSVQISKFKNIQILILVTNTELETSYNHIIII